MKRIKTFETYISEAILRDNAILLTREPFDFFKIKNRRFMYNSKTKELILGDENVFKKTHGFSSHAEEWDAVGCKTNFDSFVRGWVGVGGDYPNGIIHFAPSINTQNITEFDRAYDTIEMFMYNGANENTILRGFGNFNKEIKISQII